MLPAAVTAAEPLANALVGDALVGIAVSSVRGVAAAALAAIVRMLGAQPLPYRFTPALPETAPVSAPHGKIGGMLTKKICRPDRASCRSKIQDHRFGDSWIQDLPVCRSLAS